MVGAEPGRMILVVDDDPAMQKVLNLGLESSGFRVRVCRNGREAVELLSDPAVNPDCMLLDIRMPEMTGLEALPRLKLLRPHSPVVMLTALNDPESGLESLKKGAFDYIVKPARLQQIRETVSRAIRHREALLENEMLARKNEEYRQRLEMMVEERTRELRAAYIRIRQVNIETVQVLAETIEAKDVYTRGHCQRVRALSVGVAEHLGYEAGGIEMLEYSALLHDIGKIGIPEIILNKKVPLEEDEYRVIRTHPDIGHSILRKVEFFVPVLGAVRQHHERWDGRGYPDGLAMEQIDPFARIINVCDSFDAMTSDRPYRSARTKEEAIEEILRESGRQFDPAMARAFVESGVHSRV